MTEFVTSKDGTRIAYETQGSGPALVLVDGAMCYREFGPATDVAAALADSYTVYIYDRRGRGESGDTLPYAPAREVEDLAAVIAAAGGDAYVMGQSSGGALVLEAAASGVTMRKLASYEAPYVGQSTDFLARQKQLIAEGNRKGAIDYFMTTMVGGPFFLPLMMRLMPKVFRQLQAVAHTLPYDTELLDGFEAPVERLKAIGVPALIMGGSKYKANMKKAVHDVAGAVPDAKLVILDGQTHQVSPAVLAPVLKQFFQ
jgi:pimeloyl-ACP methyl ester carboxylesterase